MRDQDDDRTAEIDLEQARILLEELENEVTESFKRVFEPAD